MIGRNIIFNYLSQAYAALIGVFVLPWYLKIMGAEAYGLIGFFTLLQSFFSLLDLGLTSTMARQSARLSANGISTAEYLGLFRILRIFFVSAGFFGAIILGMNSELIVDKWLNNYEINDHIIVQCVILISAVLGLRWVSGLYRGIVSGFERQVWLSSFNICIATARFILPIPFLLLISPSPFVYFGFQVIVAIVELMTLGIFVSSIIPKASGLIQITLNDLRPHIRFALKVSFLSVVWVLVTQVDKLVLSKTLTLSDYGYFSLGVMSASVVLFISGPVGAALLPRLTALHAGNKIENYYDMYSQYTRMVASLVFPAALMCLAFSEQILQLWTASSLTAEKVSPVLAFYALGNAFLAISAFPYYLQYSVGDLKFHIYGNLIFLFVVVPSIIFMSIHYGMNGAAWVWVTVNILYFLFWVPVVHKRHYKGRHFSWLLKDCLKPLILSASIVAPAWLILGWNYGSAISILQLSVVGLASFFITPYGFDVLRKIYHGVQS